MHNDGNVVPLHKATTDQVAQSPLARLPAILLQVRDKAAQQLRHGLQALFDNADDTLFEMADRARCDVEQNIFFQTMRDLRLKHKSIERVFLEQFFGAFIRLAQYDPAIAAMPQALAADASLAQTDEERERSAAVDAMVSRVLDRDGLALDQLTARLCALSGKALGDLHNPMSPAMLCGYFLQAARQLGLEIKVKLIILGLFERYVLSETDRLYAEANQLLLATGVLPGLKPAPMRSTTDRPDSALVESTDGGATPTCLPIDDNVQEVFAALQALLFNVRGSLSPTLEVSATALPISTRDLLRLLSHLQQYVPAPEVVDDFDLRNQLEQLLTRVSVKSGRSRVFGEADEDVINLVAMLFECMLDDRNLPDPLKALIGRLQIPLVKVALLDKSFFSRSSHPARRLLNEIASAAMGWDACDDHQRDSLYVRIDQVVQRLLNDFIDDPSIFSELLADFLAFTQDERRRSELLEQRIRDAEEGRAKTGLARQRVEQVLNQALFGKYLPQGVLGFVQEAWSKVLLLTYLKHGDRSAEWHADVRTLEQLVWSVQHHHESDATRMLALVPDLLKSLRDGLNSSAFDPFAASEFFSELESLHVQAAGGSPASASLMIEVLAPVVLQMADESQVHSEPVRLLADDASLRQVDKMLAGCWVEFQEDAENSLRCKLVAVIENTGQYIFVNRTGMKVLERNRLDLALELRNGVVRVLDDTLLFERALESVIGNLKGLKRGK